MMPARSGLGGVVQGGGKPHRFLGPAGCRLSSYIAGAIIPLNAGATA
jgi:hypothetical protein